MPYQQVDEVRIGYFGPSDPADPLHGPMWLAAQAAIEHANHDGGFHGKPFRLLPAWSENPWGTGVKQLAQLVYEQRVWAIIGGIDGPSTHLAEQVVAKARLPLISPVATDKTVNLANVPWMFSLAPGDHLIARSLAPHIARSVGTKPFVLISGNDHDSFLLTREMRKVLDQCHVVPAYQFEFDSATQQLDKIVGQCLAAEPIAVLIVAGVDDSLQLVRLLRRQGFRHCIYGGPSMCRHRFVHQIGAVAGEIYCPLIVEPQEGFLRDVDPPGTPLSDGDYAALLTYDSMNITIDAIRQAGLNRAEIGRSLRSLAPWQGVSGTVRWDGLGGSTRPVRTVLLHNGKVVLCPRGPLRAPHGRLRAQSSEQ